ncbi:MAG: hypothetical protein QOD90_5097 [Mycobacterium sp.]|nr:hypothetical protein [Mycobacterium sp.]
MELGEELEVELDLSEPDDELDDFSAGFDFSAGLSEDFSEGGELEGSALPLEPLTVLFAASRLSLR